MPRRIAVLLLVAGCGSSGGGNGGPDGGVTSPDAARPRADADPDAPDAGGGSAPTARFTPAPPYYWYVDHAPLTIGVTGANVVKYRWALDGAAFSGDVDVATPITLAAIPPGRRTLQVIGGDAAGDWQVTPTSASFFMASGPSEPTACVLKTDGGTCDLIIDKTKSYYATSTDFYDGNNDGKPDYETLFDPAPGARICLDSSVAFQQVGIRGFRGTPEQPVAFINCGGKVSFDYAGAGSAFNLQGVRYVRVVGTGDAASPYGIAIATSGTQGANGIEVNDGSSDYEIAYLEVKSAAYAGIVTRTNVSCTINRDTFAQENTFLHHDFVHDTAGEAFYVGGSHWNAHDEVAAGALACGAAGTIDCGGTCEFESELHGVRVYANHTQDSDAEGLQVSSAFGDVDVSDGRVDYDTEIYDNLVERGDSGTSAYNTAGISIQAGTNGRFYRNRVEGTNPTGGYAGMFLAGPGNVEVFDNIIVTGTPVGLAIQDNDAGADREGPFYISNNTIVTTGSTQGIYMYHAHSVGNQCHDNIVLGATMAIRLNSSTIDWTESNDLTAGDPTAIFVDAAGGDYHLAPDSPAIDAGIDTSAWGVLADFDLVPRTGTYDDGAYGF